ncbi:MAG: hypothetical protein IJ323_01085 [Clostridia bacterium]|nr:hypothetical protein [Clostridia bacterium]
MLSEGVIIALLGIIGSAVGSFGGVLSSQKMVKYRLSKLEEKVDKHNNLVERMSTLELRNKVCEHRIENLEKKAS